MFEASMSVTTISNKILFLYEACKKTNVPFSIKVVRNQWAASKQTSMLYCDSTDTLF